VGATVKAKLKIHYYVSVGQTRFAEPVEVDFRELTADEAPLAVESADATTRWFEGRHFRRYTLNTSVQGEPRGERRAEFIVAYLQDHDRPYARGYMREGLPDEVQPVEGTLLSGYYDTNPMSSDRKFSEKRYPEFIDDPRRLTEVEGARRFAADCILVDGQFWVACAEPKLVWDERRVFVDTRHRKTVLTNSEPNQFKQPNMNDVPLNYRLVHTTFGLLEADDLLSLASESRCVPDIPDFTLHLPASLTWDRRDAHLISAGQLLVAQWEGRLEVIPPDIGHALFKIQACFWGKTPDQVDLEELSDAIFEAVAAHGRNGFGVRIVARACDDWNNRPITMELGSAPGHRL
jgi:hypothetical protein